MKKKKSLKGIAECEAYLQKCARILSAGAYRMCRDNYKLLDKSERIDPKTLKETCLAVKETAALVSGLTEDKNEAETIRIMFEDTSDCES